MRFDPSGSSAVVPLGAMGLSPAHHQLWEDVPVGDLEGHGDGQDRNEFYGSMLLD